MQLVDINSVYPSTYNPRESDPKRIEYIEYSLRKLGFLLPIYVCKKTNEILSGHQRHYVSKKIGLKQIPVEFIKPMSLEKRKAYNILFNRATNDLSSNDTSSTITKKLEKYDLNKLIEETSDVKDFYPCLKVVKVNGKKLASKNLGKCETYHKSMAQALSTSVGYMPIVITEDMKVINGIGRLFHQLEKGFEKVDCIVIPKEREKLAYVMLNLVSMDFNLQVKYKDELRYNSFRRCVTNRAGIGLGFLVGAFGGNVRTKDFTGLKGSNKIKWVKKYGTDIVDFGAGRFTDTKSLRGCGINVYPFEPYVCDKNDINKKASIETTKQFLKTVENGQSFSSIFVSSVFNSVPFFQDRLYITIICSALCSSKTIFTVWAMSETHARVKEVVNQACNSYSANNNKFFLNYEDNIMLGDFKSKPKVQKYHTRQELYDLMKNCFEDIKIKKIQNCYLVECKKPKINLEYLNKALEFEFNLPYPDGSTMNLVSEAKKAFSKRLGVKL